jgi:hypothetical protein
MTLASALSISQAGRPELPEQELVRASRLRDRRLLGQQFGEST